jgi:hypothetical protein
MFSGTNTPSSVSSELQAAWDRREKLFRVVEYGSTQGERDNALERVQEMNKKYGFDNESCPSCLEFIARSEKMFPLTVMCRCRRVYENRRFKYQLDNQSYGLSTHVLEMAEDKTTSSFTKKTPRDMRWVLWANRGGGSTATKFHAVSEFPKTVCGRHISGNTFEWSSFSKGEDAKCKTCTSILNNTWGASKPYAPKRAISLPVRWAAAAVIVLWVGLQVINSL